MQQTNIKAQDLAWMGEKSDLQGIVQKTEFCP